MKSWILSAAAVILPFSFLGAETNVVTVGQSTLTLPAPAGFVQLDAEEAISSELRDTILTPSNRMLAHFAPGEGFAEAFTPIFHAQTPRGTEAIVYSIEQFEEMTVTLAALLGGSSKEPPKNGGTASLGIHDQGDHFVQFASLRHSNPENDPESEGTLTYTAASMNNIAGSVINLYCAVPAEPESNQIWARERISKWQEAVQASNPAPLSEPKAQSIPPMIIGTIIGGVIGLLGALVCIVVLKNKKTQKAEA